MLASRGLRDICISAQELREHRLLFEEVLPLRETRKSDAVTKGGFHLWEGLGDEHGVITDDWGQIVSTQMLHRGPELPCLKNPILFDDGRLGSGYTSSLEKFVVWDFVKGSLRAEIAICRGYDKEYWHVLSGKHNLLVHILHNEDYREISEISIWDSSLKKIQVLQHTGATGAFVMRKEGIVVSMSSTSGEVMIWKPLQDYIPVILTVPNFKAALPIRPGCIRLEDKDGRFRDITDKGDPYPKENICAEFADGSYIKSRTEHRGHYQRLYRVPFSASDEMSEEPRGWQCLTYLDRYLITTSCFAAVSVWSKQGKLIARTRGNFLYPKILLSRTTRTIIIFDFDSLPETSTANVSSAYICTFIAQ